METIKFNVNGKIANVPKEHVAEFKKLYPNAVEVTSTTFGTTVASKTPSSQTVALKTRKPYTGQFEKIPAGWNVDNALKNLNKTIRNNSSLYEDLLDSTKEHLSKVSGKNKTYADDALKMDHESLINNFLNFQRQVYKIGFDIKDFKNFDPDGKWDKSLDEYNKKATSLGLQPLSRSETAAAQAFYKAMRDAKKSGRYDDELKNYQLEQHGVTDEEEGNISPVDGWFGNTTVGQGIFRFDQDPAPVEEIKTEEIKGIPTNPLQDQYRAPSKDPFWKQDVLSMGRDFSNLMSINKYLPWAEKPEFFEADPTFYDPNRALAANAEQASLASEASSMYSGPQASSARLAKIQGDASRNAANIISEYDKRNVDVANRFEMFNAQGRNQAARVNANVDNELYKGWVIANQQYDNSKRAMKNNLMNTYINAITNKTYTANLNDLFPEFSIDPSKGGRLKFTPSNTIISPSTPNDPIKDIINLKNTYKDIDIKDLVELYLLNQNGLSETNTANKRKNDSVNVMSAMFGKR